MSTVAARGCSHAREGRHEQPDTDPAGRPATVAEVISPDPVTTRPDADVAETMLACDAVAGIISRRDILRAMVRGDDVPVAEIQQRLDVYAEGRRWTTRVENGVAHLGDTFPDDTERGIVLVLARTVPGGAAVKIG